MAVIVVGAGVTGLTAGLKLAKAGKDVVLLEKESVVVGLCRTFDYGDFRFDIGPHRLFSSDPVVSSFFTSVLGNACHPVSRVSCVRLNGALLEWPLSLGSVRFMKPQQLAGCLKDLLVSRSHRDDNIDTLEDFVLARYGRTIYETFWEAYTEKFLGIPCSEVDASWGDLSVGRSVVDRKKQPSGLLSLLSQCAMSSSKTRLDFLYPTGGMGRFPDRCAQRISKHGGSILLNQRVEKIHTEGRRIVSITANGTELPVDELIWTAPLTELTVLLGRAPLDLTYLSTVLYNLEVEGTMPGEWQWVYYPSREIIFSRISRPDKFEAALTPEGMTGLCVEVTGQPGSPVLEKPEDLTPRILDDLVRSNIIDRPERVRACHIERIENTYPVYRRGFRSIAERGMETSRAYENLSMVGRQAQFIHDNIDEAIRHAIDLSEELVGHTATTEPLACTA